MTGNFLGIVENVTFATDVSKKEPKFGVLADLSKTELLVYQKQNFCINKDQNHVYCMSHDFCYSELKEWFTINSFNKYNFTLLLNYIYSPGKKYWQ